MSQRQSGGLESAAIRRAWVSGDPVGFESAAIRRALSQRRAGGHWVRGGPAGIESEVVWSPANGAPGGAATRELGNPPAGLGEPLPVADISRDRQAWGLAASGLTAIPPNSHAVLQWAMAGLRVATSLPRDRHKQTDWNKTKDFWKRKNKTGWMGAAYGLGLVFCHGAHSREDTGNKPNMDTRGGNTWHTHDRGLTVYCHIDILISIFFCPSIFLQGNHYFKLWVV